MNVNWYRNASEKENNKSHGTGELLNILCPAQTSECIAIIVDSTGNFVEKQLSLVKQDDLAKVVDTSELEAKIVKANKTIERLDLEHGERKVLLEEVSKKLITSQEESKELHGELTIALDEIAKLKKPKPVSPKK